jgi:hypothetical protein
MTPTAPLTPAADPGQPTAHPNGVEAHGEVLTRCESPLCERERQPKAILLFTLQAGPVGTTARRRAAGEGWSRRDVSNLGAVGALAREPIPIHFPGNSFAYPLRPAPKVGSDHLPSVRKGIPARAMFHGALFHEAASKPRIPAQICQGPRTG